MKSLLWTLGALSASSALVVQVIGSHKPWDSEKKITFNNGFNIQLSSAIGLILLAHPKFKGRLKIASATSLFLGSSLFSSLLYYRCFYDDRRYSYLMPYSGSSVILGWLLMACL